MAARMGKISGDGDIGLEYTSRAAPLDAQLGTLGISKSRKNRPVRMKPGNSLIPSLNIFTYDVLY